jgi:hypothetical protein
MPSLISHPYMMLFSAKLNTPTVLNDVDLQYYCHRNLHGLFSTVGTSSFQCPNFFFSKGVQETHRIKFKEFVCTALLFQTGIVTVRQWLVIFSFFFFIFFFVLVSILVLVAFIHIS